MAHSVAVTVHPGAKKARVAKDEAGTLHVYVNQPPLDGRANQAAAEALAGHFGVSRSRVQLVRGAKSRQKVFHIDD